MLSGIELAGGAPVSLGESKTLSPTSRHVDSAGKEDAGQLLEIPFNTADDSLFSPLSPNYSTPPGSPFPVDSSSSLADTAPPSLSRSSSSSSDTSTSTGNSLRVPRSRPTPRPLVLEKRSSWSEAAEDDNRTAKTFTSSPGPLTAVPGSSSRPSEHPHASLTSRHKTSSDMPSTWVAQQRARSPLAEGPDPLAAVRPSFPVHPASPRAQVTHRNIPDLPPSSPTPPPHLVSAPQPVRSPSYSHTVASPCFVHSHLDHSLSDFVNRDVAPGSAKKRKEKKDKPRVPVVGVAGGLGMNGLVNEEEESETASEGAGSGSEDDEDEQPSLTRQLAETAVSVREMSKQLGRARVVSHIQSVMIITKARDNHLIRLTRELALWLMQTPRNGRDRGLVVYVDTQLRKSKRFDAEGLERDNPALFRPLARRYSRTSSSVSLSGSAMFDSAPKRGERMTPMSSLNDAFKRSGSMDYEKKRETDEGQLRYWTNEMCTKSPHLFDFVVTLGGDGTVLYASWLFQHVVPPVIPFALGSLGFLTNFDFSTYAHTLNNAIDNGIRVNLRMRFTCTVYRAVEGDGNKKRRAIRSGKTGEIFMKSLTKAGWEAIESGGVDAARESGRTSSKGKGKDKEIKCFSTRPVESFEVLNDLVVDRGPSPYVSLLELFGDEHHMTTVQADGLTVSTPTGSTAYSLSAGGSLVHPEIPAMLITPICPHTLSFRPMLLPDSMELRICVPYHSRATAWASFDGRGRVELKQGDHIKVTASAYPFPTVCADKQSTDWFTSIEKKLQWNERQRQKSFVILEEGRKKPRDVDDDRRAAENANSPDGGAAQRPEGEKVDCDSEGEEDDDEDDDDFAEEEEEEGFDIDDLSSDNHTNSSSPVTTPHDPSGLPPLLSRLSTMSSPSSTAHQPLRHDRDHSSSSSTVDLTDSNADRYQDRPPRPPRLSARHSHNDSSAVYDRTPISAPPHINSHRLSAATMRRRERGEEGDRDFMHEQPGSARKGTRKRGKSLERGTRGEAEESTSRAFAVVGIDSDSSVSDSEA